MVGKVMEKVVVLMSTYNGEKYLREQLESIFNQEGVEVTVIVRDDGSTDQTISILKEYEKKESLQFYTGENLKPARSFMDLMYNASSAKYYALCDQDDVWTQGKLKAAVEFLRICNKPALYYHGMNLVDRELNKYGYYFREQEKAESLELSCFYGDEIAGCTMVFNDELMKKIREYKPTYITMHDGWIHRVCLCVHGCIYGDKTAYINYRQHGNNAVGMRQRKISDQFSEMEKKECKFSRLAKEMMQGYKQYLNPNERALLKNICGYQENVGSNLHLCIRCLTTNASLKLKLKCLIKIVCRAL